MTEQSTVDRDRAFTLPDGVAEQLAYAANPFKGIVDLQSPELRAAAREMIWLEDKPAATPAIKTLGAAANGQEVPTQGQGERGEIMSLLSLIGALPTAASAKLKEIQQKLQAALITGRMPEDMSKSEILEAIYAAEREFASGAAEAAETPEQKRERLWAEIRALDEEQDKRYEEMVKQQLITEKQYEDWKKLKEYADAHPEDRAAQERLEKFSRELNTQANDRAVTPDQHKLVDDAERNTEKRINDRVAMDNIRLQKDREGQDNKRDSQTTSALLGETPNKTNPDSALTNLTPIKQTPDDTPHAPPPKTLAAKTAPAVGLLG